MIFATARAALAIGILATGVCLTAAGPEPAKAPRPSASQIGKAAWYGGQFHGRQTASGELFDMYGFTAAHRDLPLGTLVRVTNVASRKSVIVRINDRGPWTGAGRIIDLSYAASRALGMVVKGVAMVKLEPLYSRRAAAISVSAD